ncbi:hypothetical protein [Streptomyces sp. NPDC058644]|uniref:hypothetical protein n=1 Tax=unclassified Streptomyces TaxID=2593676 RepID=UPI0036510F62
MTEPRKTADTITDDDLDQLYARLDRARDATALHRQGLIATTELYAVIEATPEPGPAAPETEKTARVIALYEQWVKAGPPPLGTPVSRWWDTRLAELATALNPAKEQ